MSTSLDMEYELQQRDERIKNLQDALNGTIKTYGDYNHHKNEWSINTSSILSKLIHEAGRWCESYASDLFVLWRYNVESFIEHGCRESKNLIFAFRDCGVDDNSFYQNNKETYNYYRAIWKLKIEVDGDRIYMTLEKARN